MHVKRYEQRTAIMNRLVLKLGLFLLLGAIINIAVAWGCAAWVRFGHAETYAWGLTSSDVPCWDVFITQKRGGQWVFAAPVLRRSCWNIAGGSDAVRSELAMMRGTLAAAPAGEVDPIRAVINQASGWPMLSLYWEAERWGRSSARSGSEVVRGGIMLSSNRAADRMQNEVIALPLRPIWMGSLVNAMFYGIVVQLLWAAPFAIRRVVRHRRGLCTACGYDLRGRSRAPDSNVCPECGTNTSHRS